MHSLVESRFLHGCCLFAALLIMGCGPDEPAAETSTADTSQNSDEPSSTATTTSIELEDSPAEISRLAVAETDRRLEIAHLLAEIEDELAELGDPPIAKSKSTTDATSATATPGALNVPQPRLFYHGYDFDDESAKSRTNPAIVLDDMPLSPSLRLTASFPISSAPPAEIRFGVGTYSQPERPRFSADQQVALRADGEVLVTGETRYERQEKDGEFKESLVIMLPLSELLRLTNAREVNGSAGDKEFRLYSGHLEALRDLASRIPSGPVGELTVGRESKPRPPVRDSETFSLSLEELKAVFLKETGEIETTKFGQPTDAHRGITVGQNSMMLRVLGDPDKPVLLEMMRVVSPVGQRAVLGSLDLGEIRWLVCIRQLRRFAKMALPEWTESDEWLGEKLVPDGRLPRQIVSKAAHSHQFKTWTIGLTVGRARANGEQIISLVLATPAGVEADRALDENTATAQPAESETPAASNKDPAERLAEAKALLEDDARAAGDILSALVEEHPDTPIAKQAAELLKQANAKNNEAAAESKLRLAKALLRAGK